ncbi:Elongator complex protein 3 [Thelohanellus kitauei]|uniref:Elongator complex protein 3 n=1 Tax=Thelohanellus kitauei TaxID=669202 RepID=A0A0C2IEV2_THEKT|nr:Elongator complex protein 3 [Thelohanellus kitauei]
MSYPTQESRFNVISAIICELSVMIDRSLPINMNEILLSVCKKFRVQNPPRLLDIISACPSDIKNHLVKVVQRQPVRTKSGIAVVAVMARPHRCPHIYYTGHICVYCPGGPDSDFAYSSQAYTGYEPTSKLAISRRYDPYLQVRTKLSILEASGHNTDKIELIILGGTFMSLEAQYRERFIIDLHDALSGRRSLNLEEAIIYADHSSTHRCIGLTIETRPDYCQVTHLRHLLAYGCTRIEIGIQSIYEDVALETNRGHTVEAACQTLQMAKDHGFKITAHMMPDLPNVGLERDIYQFEEFFTNPAFRSDGLKIYPTLVIRGTGIYELWKTKRYQNYTAAELIDLISYVLSAVPPWVRVFRVQREIPMPLISACGLARSDLRMLVEKRMESLGLRCRDVRAREVGMKYLAENIALTNIELVRRDYYANGGWETFISFEDLERDILVGLLRLRKCLRNPLTADAYWSIVRELHVYGQTVGISERDAQRYQHRGYGELLIEEAERIAYHEHGSFQIGVISGVGVRNYYRRLGYWLKGLYMIKDLDS